MKSKRAVVIAVLIVVIFFTIVVVVLFFFLIWLLSKDKIGNSRPNKNTVKRWTSSVHIHQILLYFGSLSAPEAVL
jgi:flagellar basal body-associated protein FliL